MTRDSYSKYLLEFVLFTRLLAGVRIPVESRAMFTVLFSPLHSPVHFFNFISILAACLAE